MSEQLYLDANLFIYAAVNTDGIGIRARSVLEKVKNGDINGVSSILVLDEVLWVVQKSVGRDDAYKAVSTLILCPNIVWVDATKNIFADALHVYKEGVLNPRDAIHFATMRFKNVKTIITNDDDFDNVQNIKRMKI